MFPGEDEIFLDGNVPIHAAGLIQSWIDEHENEVQCLFSPTYFLDLSAIESLWSILECSTQNGYPLLVSHPDNSLYLHE